MNAITSLDHGGIVETVFKALGRSRIVGTAG